MALPPLQVFSVVLLPKITRKESKLKEIRDSRSGKEKMKVSDKEKALQILHVPCTGKFLHRFIVKNFANFAQSQNLILQK